MADANEVTTLVRTALKNLHVQNSKSAIELPNAAGVFPAPRISAVPPVVADANTLRNDVLYSCTHEDRRTTLVTATNTGLIRLFCARHVLAEVAEHHREWAEEKGVSAASFAARWKADYAPQLRVVADVDDALLSPEESARVDELRSKDPDDVPSAVLSLVLQGFYLSTDGPATTAVYGTKVASAELQAWRAVLQAGGDAGMLGVLFETTVVVTGALGNGVWQLFDRLTRALPGWARVVVVGACLLGGGYLVHKMSEDAKRSVGRGLDHAMRVVAAVSGEHAAAIERLRVATPAMPSWDELATSRDPESVLARACLHTLARSKTSDRSAAELAEQLPELPVARGAAKVRSTLRSRPYFTEVYRGRWQVGAALVRQTRDVPQQS